MTPTAIDHLLIFCTCILLPIHDLLFWYPRLVRADANHRARARSQAYLESTLVEWSLLGAMLAWWGFQGRDWAEVGISVPGGWGFWLGLAIAATIIVVITRQRLSLSRDPDPEVREAVLHQLANLRPLLPHTRSEMKRFSLVAVTAGVCEEALFRGLLIWYLQTMVPTAATLLLAALLFGMAHAYQGTRGVIQTGIVGMGLVLLYVISGSLWIPIVLHAFFDLNSGLLAYTFLRRESNASLDTP